jgi:hypothetical protein
MCSCFNQPPHISNLPSNNNGLVVKCQNPNCTHTHTHNHTHKYTNRHTHKQTHTHTLSIRTRTWGAPDSWPLSRHSDGFPVGFLVFELSQSRLAKQSPCMCTFPQTPTSATCSPHKDVLGARHYCQIDRQDEFWVLQRQRLRRGYTSSICLPPWQRWRFCGGAV